MTKLGMRVAWLVLCCLLLEGHNLDFGLAIPNNVKNQHAVPYATNEALHDNDLPGFAGPMDNVTAASGREAILSCTVKKLGNYKVGWLRVEDQTVISIGRQIVSHSSRYSISLENNKIKNQSEWHRDQDTTWKLHIRLLKEADRGCYMCQLNTKPMLKQTGCLDVLVPPDILIVGTSAGEVSVAEGENATLTCNASGRPRPKVLWRREKNKNILVRRLHEQWESADSLPGERLELNKVDRKQMGAYLCIASNEVPPAVSKRVYLRVNFKPTAIVTNQLVASPVHTDVTLICLTEGYPKAMISWQRHSQVIMDTEKYEIIETRDPEEEWRAEIKLRIKRLEANDFGEYTCAAASSLGKANATLRVSEIHAVTVPTQSTLVTWKKPSKSKSQFAQTTTQNFVHLQLSTPSLEKSTSRLVYVKPTATTMDPRRDQLTKNNAYKNNVATNSQSSTRIKMKLHRLLFIFFTFPLLPTLS